MKNIDYSKLKASPETEDFAGKYENNGKIARYLVNSYFKAVSRLVSKTKGVEVAHEIGVGEGRSTMRLKALVPKLSGSEFVTDLVVIAQKNNPELNIFNESIYDLTFEDESVDLIFLLEVLEHLDYPKLALKELKRVSKKYIILGVPREPIWCILNMFRLKYLKHLGNTPGHLNHWSKKQLIKLIENEYGKVIAVESPLPWTIVLAEKHSL